MFNKISTALVMISASVLLLAGCGSNGAAVTVKPGEVFTLGIGQTAKITGENMTITFNDVVGDSRAPENAQAIWEGVATSSITIDKNGVKHPMLISQPGRTEQSTATFDGYSLTHSLNPYPVAGKEISSKDYRLTITVVKTEGLTPGGPSAVPIVDNAALIHGNVVAVTRIDSTQPWLVSIGVISVENVGELPNRFTGTEGQTLQVRTDKDVSSLRAGNSIVATIKLSGDEGGIFIYASQMTW